MGRNFLNIVLFSSMIIGEDITYSVFFSLGLACHLAINGGVIGWKERGNKASLFFAASCVALSFILSYKIVHTEKLLQEITALLTWALFYLHLLFHHRDFKLRWNAALHLFIPLSWLAIHQFQLLPQVVGVFDIIYLSSIIGYGWMSMYEVSKLQRVAQWKASYLKALFLGLIIIISLRFLLPIIFHNAENYIRYFHALLGVFFLLLSSFYIKAPIKNLDEQEAAIQRAEALNYEEELKRKLKNAMLKEKVFLDPDLTLDSLGNRLDMKSTELSNFINNNLGKNFNDFINGYRVEEVKRLMENPSTDPQATIMELAYKAGFNSKASFNRIFKQFTQMTPSQYRKLHQEVNE
ncbi:MAG: AraC family transcriptional regulator [Bacteroidota bacterium]